MTQPGLISEVLSALNADSLRHLGSIWFCKKEDNVEQNFLRHRSGSLCRFNPGFLIKETSLLRHLRRCKKAGLGLLNKSSSLAAALGVAELTNVRDRILVTLCCATEVQLRCSTNPPQGSVC